MRKLSWIFRLVPALLPAPFLNAQVGIGPELLVWQADSPLQVIAAALPAQSIHLDLLGRLTVANVSDKPVIRYTLGWLLVDNSGRNQLGIFLGKPVEASLAPGDTHIAPPQGADVDPMYRFARSKGFQSGRLIVGAVQVVFTDGSEWNYPLLRIGGFREQKDPALEERLRPIFERQRQWLDSLQPQQNAGACGGRR